MLRKHKIISNLSRVSDIQTLADRVSKRGLTIFISYSWVHKNVVDEIDTHFQSLGIHMKRDIRELDSYESVSDFMRQVREVDFVMMVISDEYLRSINCMYEMLQFVKDENYRERIIPVFVPGTKTQMFEPGSEAPYIKHWRGECQRLEGEIEGLPPDSTEELSKALDLARQIRHAVGGFMGTARDRLLVPLATLQQSGFREVLERIYKAQEDKERLQTELQQTLTARYTDSIHSHIILLFSDSTPMPIEDCYINLAIVRESVQREKEERMTEAGRRGERPEREPEPLGLLHIWEDIHAPKEPIELEKLIEIKERGRQAQRLLVMGRAGIGKSTLCQRIANQWAQNKLWPGRFQYLFWIPLRNLNADNYPRVENSQLLDILLTECFPANQRQAVRQTLQRVLDTNPERLLFMLDGYDEAVNIPKHLQPILAEKLLQQPNVILTSRPNPGLPMLDVRLEVIGFTDENIDVYTQMYFKQRERPEKAESLSAFIKVNPGVKGCAHIPINLELICSLWDYKQLSAPMSVTELYSEMSTLLYRRYLREKQHRTDEADMTDRRVRECCMPAIQSLGELAYRGMETGEIILGAQLVEPVLDASPEAVQIGDLLEMGLLKPTREIAMRTKNDYYFVHLTFQEYLAAEWLAHQEPAVMKQFLNEHKYQPQYQTMLGFLAGIINREDRSTGKTRLVRFLRMLEEGPRDLVGVCHNLLLIHCLDQCPDGDELYERLNEETQVMDRLCGWIDSAAKGELEGKMIVWNITNTCQTFFGSRRISDLLVAILMDKTVDERVRRSMADDLGRIGQADEKVIRAMVTVFKDENEDIFVMNDTVKALGEIGQADEKVISELVAILRDETADGLFRSTAAEALGKIGQSSGKVINTLVAILRDETVDKWVRCSVAKALGEIGKTNEKVISALVAVLRDNKVDDSIRESIATAIGEIRHADEKVIKVIVSVLRNRSVTCSFRISAGKALGKIGQVGKEAIRAMMFFLREHSSREVIFALGAIGQADEKAAQTLIDILMDKVANRNDRKFAAEALGYIRQKNTRVIHTLTSILGDQTEDDYLRREAASALGKIGQVDETAIMTLVTVLRDKMVDDNIKYIATWSLGRIGQADEGVLPMLVAILNDESIHSYVRMNAAEALGEIGHADLEVIQALVTTLRDQTACDEIRYAAVSALGKIRQMDEVIQSLVSFLEDQTMDVCLRCNTTEVLGNIGQADEKAIKTLTTISKDETEDGLIRHYAVKALGRIRHVNEVVIQTLVSFFIEHEKDILDGWEAKYALSKLNLGQHRKYIQSTPLEKMDMILESTPLSLVTNYCLKLGNPLEWINLVVNRAFHSTSALWVDVERKTVNFVEDNQIKSLDIPGNVEPEKLEKDIREVATGSLG